MVVGIFRNNLHSTAKYGRDSDLRRILSDMKESLNDKQFRHVIDYKDPLDHMRTPLLACLAGWHEMIRERKCLLDYGRPHNMKDEGYVNVQRLLIEAGADTSLKDADGYDALIYPRPVIMRIEDTAYPAYMRIGATCEYFALFEVLAERNGGHSLEFDGITLGEIAKQVEKKLGDLGGDKKKSHIREAVKAYRMFGEAEELVEEERAEEIKEYERQRALKEEREKAGCCTECGHKPERKRARDEPEEGEKRQRKN